MHPSKPTYLLFLFALILCSCNSSKKIERYLQQDFRNTCLRKENSAGSTKSFLAQLYLLPVRQREDSLLAEMLAGNMPVANFKFIKLTYKAADAEGKICTVSLWVAPDYVAIGKDADFVRIPLSPQAGQFIADKFNCVLPTTKMVDEIYKAAIHKLIPLPLTTARDALATFVYHDSLIQNELGRAVVEGIIAGHKKDVVQSMAVLQNEKANRVAIYGWQQPDGKPIQPLYTGHVDWYVDYSHGIRLVYKKMLINNKVYLVNEVLNNPNLAPLICKDSLCGAMRYPAAK